MNRSAASENERITYNGEGRGGGGWEETKSEADRWMDGWTDGREWCFPRLTIISSPRFLPEQALNFQGCYFCSGNSVQGSGGRQLSSCSLIPKKWKVKSKKHNKVNHF